jgi:hypothetical protein
MARAFERPATIALPDVEGESGLVLEGLFVPVPGARVSALIAPPHPLMGGSMESPVVTEIAWQCQKAGIASLRFNWRGVGASAGTASGDPALADVDFQAALEFLRETLPGRQVACGYSFGAAAALRSGLASRAVESLVLVAPPTSLLDVSDLKNFEGRIFLASAENDEWVDSELLSRAVADLATVHLEVVAGCDHFFMSGLDVLGRALGGWWQ